MNLSISLPKLHSSRVYRITVSAFFFVAGLTFSTWASRIPDIKEKLQLSDAALGTILFALPVGLITSLPISGYLVTKFGSRRLVIAASLLYPITLLLLGGASSSWQLVGGLFLFGLWSNLMNIAMNTQAVSVEGLYGKSIMASFHGLWSLAGFTGALAGTFFVSNSIAPIWHFAGIILVTLLLVFVTYKHVMPDNPEDKSGKAPLFAKPDKQLWILGLIAFCCLMCEGAMADWSGVYFQKVVNTPSSMMTIGYLAFTSTMATGRFLGDGLVRRLGVVKMLQLSGSLIAGGLLISILFPFLVPATIGFLLVGFGVSSVVPIVYGLAGRSTTMPTSVALAAVSTIGFLGFLLGPPVIGFIAEAFSLRVSFAVVAALGVVSVVMARKAR
jgi:MFS family permease